MQAGRVLGLFCQTARTPSFPTAKNARLPDAEKRMPPALGGAGEMLCGDKSGIAIDATLHDRGRNT